MRVKSFQSSTYKFINYCEMSLQDNKDIWELRNHPLVRVWMIDDKEIPWSSHNSFIDNLRSNDIKDYFIIKDLNDKIIGSVNITYTDLGISERGIFIDPEFWGHGHAFRSMTEFYNGIKDLSNVKVIKTVVKKDNTASNGLEMRLGAEFIEEEDGLNHYLLALK